MEVHGTYSPIITVLTPVLIATLGHLRGAYKPAISTAILNQLISTMNLQVGLRARRWEQIYTGTSQAARSACGQISYSCFEVCVCVCVSLCLCWVGGGLCC